MTRAFVKCVDCGKEFGSDLPGDLLKIVNCEDDGKLLEGFHLIEKVSQ